MNTCASSSADGLVFYATGSSLRFQVRGNSANAIDITTDVSVPTGMWALCAISVNEAAGASGSFFYCNGTSSTFDATYSSPSTNSAGRPGLGARSDGAGPFPSGTQLVGVQLYNRALSKTELDQNFTAIRSRFGI